MGNNQKIPFNFTYYAMKLLGKNLYSNPWTAVSEIVANGIDAGANNVYVLIDMRNKEKAIVEIFDDGSGMSFSDLSQKYTLIGRNKRLGEDNREGKTLGRKGIGKLAALYLSSRYSLFTKTSDGKSCWEVDTNGILDSDIPALVEITYDSNSLISKSQWEKLNTGTMIQLSDVDLRKIGPERLKSLPAMLADYYLDTVIKTNILVCVIQNDNDFIEFRKIEKVIHFDTMYGMFDNTELGYKNLLQEKVYLTKKKAEPKVNIPRKTIVLDENKYNCSGKIQMVDINGVDKEIPYKLVGWIGIHSSLDNEILERNSPNAKKIQNHPNALRLYVRGKLAVNNLMPYIASTAAFASYIEGEISFDILDDDLFEDASTSNREGYSISDPRIKKLTEVVGKIITSLVVERNKIGNKINEEIKAIKEAKEAEAKLEKKRREAAERLAEQERKNARVAQEDRKKAENERDVAIEQSDKAKERLFVLENNFTSEGENYKHAVHLSVNFAKEIRSLVSDFEEYDDVAEEILQTVMDIDLSAAKIENLPKFVDSATFSLSSPKIKTDIMKLIKEYLEVKGNSRLNYLFEISESSIIELDFPSILMFLENVISNSIKASASSLTIKSNKVDGHLRIDFIDNGKGLDPKYKNNPQEIFELGETSTYEGFGIGAFHMREIIKTLHGEIFAIPSDKNGLIIRVVI